MGQNEETFWKNKKLFVGKSFWASWSTLLSQKIIWAVDSGQRISGITCKPARLSTNICSIVIFLRFHCLIGPWYSVIFLTLASHVNIEKPGASREGPKLTKEIGDFFMGPKNPWKNRLLQVLESKVTSTLSKVTLNNCTVKHFIKTAFCCHGCCFIGCCSLLLLFAAEKVL